MATFVWAFLILFGASRNRCWRREDGVVEVRKRGERIRLSFAQRLDDVVVTESLNYQLRGEGTYGTRYRRMNRGEEELRRGCEGCCRSSREQRLASTT